MAYDLLSSGSSVSSALRAGCDPFDLPNNMNGINNYSNNNYSNTNNPSGGGNFPFKPLALSYTPSPRTHLTMAEQAELEFELRYRGNMIVDQQRKIQQLEEELKRTREEAQSMSMTIASYEQDRMKEKKKPQSRYWTPDEHQRFLEALNKFGHKDVKAISGHVSTRNATQVRTHAQKYFLRLERERRKREGGDDGGFDGGYGSSDGEFSDQSMSPLEELSPQQTHSGISTPPPLNPSIANLQNQPRRRRATSLITPTLGKSASNHREAVLAELPAWTVEDYDLFVKGLLANVDKQQEDIPQIAKCIQEGYVPHMNVDDVEACYKLVHKLLKQKPVLPPTMSSPKRRRTSKPELPVGLPTLNMGGDGPLPAMGAMTLGGGPGSPFTSFMGSVSSNASPNISHQYGSNFSSSAGTLMPFQSMGSPLLNLNMGSGSGGAPLRMEYPPMHQMSNTSNMGLSNMMTTLDISSVAPSTQSHSGWNPLAYPFDLHQGAPLVSSTH